MTEVTAFANQKGGVGKSTVTVNIAAALTDRGRKVCILDLDPQQNASQTLDADGQFDIYDVMHSDEPGVIADAIVQTSWPAVSAVPGSSRLALLEQESIMTPEHRLKNAMWQAQELDQFDDILIDLPPSLGRLTLNGLIVATRVVVVTSLETYSIDAVGQFLETLTAVRKNPQLNPALRLAGVIVNSAALNTIDHQAGLQELKDGVGLDIIKPPYLRRSTVVPAAAGAHKPVSRMPGAAAAALTTDFARHAQWLTHDEEN